MTECAAGGSGVPSRPDRLPPGRAGGVAGHLAGRPGHTGAADLEVSVAAAGHLIAAELTRQARRRAPRWPPAGRVPLRADSPRLRRGPGRLAGGCTWTCGLASSSSGGRRLSALDQLVSPPRRTRPDRHQPRRHQPARLRTRAAIIRLPCTKGLRVDELARANHRWTLATTDPQGRPPRWPWCYHRPPPAALDVYLATRSPDRPPGHGHRLAATHCWPLQVTERPLRGRGRCWPPAPGRRLDPGRPVAPGPQPGPRRRVEHLGPAAHTHRRHAAITVALDAGASTARRPRFRRAPRPPPAATTDPGTAWTATPRITLVAYLA